METFRLKLSQFDLNLLVIIRELGFSPIVFATVNLLSGFLHYYCFTLKSNWVNCRLFRFRHIRVSPSQHGHAVFAIGKIPKRVTDKWWC